MASSVLLIISTYRLRKSDKPNPGQLQQQLGVKTEYSEPSSDDIYSSVLPLVWEVDSRSMSDNGLRVSFLYRCLLSCDTLWLGVGTAEDLEPEIEILMRHPLLDGTWPHVADSQFRLYQEAVAYPSMTSFWERPPTTHDFVADDHIANQLPAYIPVVPLRLYDSLDKPRLLLTTYEKPRIFGAYDEFARTILRSSLPDNVGDELFVYVYTDDPQKVELVYTLPSFTEVEE